MDTNTYTTDGLRVCLYRTMHGHAGFVEGVHAEDYLYGHVHAPDPMTNALQAARLVARVRKDRGR